MENSSINITAVVIPLIILSTIITTIMANVSCLALA